MPAETQSPIEVLRRPIEYRCLMLHGKQRCSGRDCADARKALERMEAVVRVLGYLDAYLDFGTPVEGTFTIKNPAQLNAVFKEARAALAPFGKERS
jgi:hypothetical protein